MRRRVAERVVTHADCALAVHLWELVTTHFQVGHVLAVTLKDDFQQHLVETTALSRWSMNPEIQCKKRVVNFFLFLRRRRERLWIVRYDAKDFGANRKY